MTAGIFLLFAVVLLLALFRKRTPSILLAGITMILAIAMLYHHMTEVIPVRL